MKSKQRKYEYLPSVSYESALLLTGDIVSVKDLADQNVYSYKQKNKRSFYFFESKIMIQNTIF